MESVTTVGIALRDFSMMTGVSRAVGELARRLPALGFAPLVLARRLPAQAPAGVRVERMSLWNLSSRIRAASFDWLARRRLARESVGLVHGHGDLTRQDVLSVHNCDAAAARWVPDGRRPSAGVRYVRDRQFAHCRRVVANSDMVRRDVSAFYGVAPEKIRTVYCGVDLERFHPRRREESRRALLAAAGWSAEAFVVLSVLSGDPAKRNFPLMARAVEAAKGGRPVVFCVVGNVPWKKEAAAVRLAEKGRLHAVPATPRVEDYFAAADVFVLPAFYEEFGLTALEALASGCPVVSGRRVGAAELLKDGESGFLLDDLADPAALSALLLRASEGALSPSAARRAAEPFTWDRHAREIAAVYRELL